MPFLYHGLRMAAILVVTVFVLAACCCRAFGAPANEAETREFSQFSVQLPAGWDGDEQTGFISDNPEEYQLTLGKKDEEGERFLAQVSIFLLPNKPGANARDAASTLAEAQGESTEPVKEGNFWTFTGEPRSRTVKGMAKTLVSTTPENLLIIIAQDPLQLGSDTILKSLKGMTPRAKTLLGTQD